MYKRIYSTSVLSIQQSVNKIVLAQAFQKEKKRSTACIVGIPFRMNWKLQVALKKREQALYGANLKIV